MASGPVWYEHRVAFVLPGPRFCLAGRSAHIVEPSGEFRVVRLNCASRLEHKLDVEVGRLADTRYTPATSVAWPVEGEKVPTILNSPCQVPVTLVEPGLFLKMNTWLGLEGTELPTMCMRAKYR